MRDLAEITHREYVRWETRPVLKALYGMLQRPRRGVLRHVMLHASARSLGKMTS